MRSDLTKAGFPRSAQAKHSGMTLIEVMVALAVFALAAVSVVTVASEHIRSIAYLEQKTIALWVANNHLAELELQGKFPGLGTKKGDIEYAGSTWYWQQQTEKTVDTDFRSITVRIYDEEKSEHTLAELQSYMVKK